MGTLLSTVNIADLAWVIGQIERGFDMSVQRIGDRRKIVFRDGARAAGELDRDHADYESLMEALVTELAAGHGSRHSIDFKLDFYGRQWVEIRGGLLGLRKSRLGMSPRYIDLLHSAVLSTGAPDPRKAS